MKRSNQQTDNPEIALTYSEEEGILSIPQQSASISTSQRENRRRTQHRIENDLKVQTVKKNMTWSYNQNYRRGRRGRQCKEIYHERKKNKRRPSYSRGPRVERRVTLFSN